MIAIANTPSPAHRTCAGKDQARDSHERFLHLLPAIRRHALVSFRDLDSEAREDAVQAAVGIAWANFRRLVALGRTELVYAGPLARYAVSRVRDGRGIGTRRNIRDITSSCCQRRRGLQIESLDQLVEQDGQWREMVVEDRRAGPAEIAAARLDLAAWLRLLPQRYRVIANVLASGETTCATARLFHISPGRVSQIRRELYEAWCRFQGETCTVPSPNPACT